jgi:hypothetical protein
MVVNIASLPSAVTLVAGAVRDRGCGTGTCALAIIGANTTAQNSLQIVLRKKLAMDPVAVLTYPAGLLPGSFEVGQTFLQSLRLTDESLNSPIFNLYMLLRSLAYSRDATPSCQFTVASASSQGNTAPSSLGPANACLFPMHLLTVKMLIILPWDGLPS